MALSIDEFAMKVKEKYPVYQNIDNTELTNKVLQKFPEYKDQVDFAKPEPIAPTEVRETFIPALEFEGKKFQTPEGEKGFEELTQEQQIAVQQQFKREPTQVERGVEAQRRFEEEQKEQRRIEEQKRLQKQAELLKPIPFKKIGEKTIEAALGAFETLKTGAGEIVEAVFPTEERREIKEPLTVTREGVTTIIPAEEVTRVEKEIPTPQERITTGVSGVFNIIKGALGGVFAPLSGTIEASPQPIKFIGELIPETINTAGETAALGFLDLTGIDPESREGQVIREGFKLALQLGAIRGAGKEAPKIQAATTKAIETGKVIIERAKPVVEEAVITAGEVAAKVRKALEKSEQAQKVGFAEKLIREKPTPKKIQESFKREGVEGILEGKGKLTQVDKTLARDLAEIVPEIKEGFFRGEKLRQNGRTIKSRQVEIARDIESRLKESTRKIEPRTLEASLESIKNQLVERGEFGTLTGNAPKIFTELSKKLKDIYEQGIKDGKWEADSIGLWEARKAFDQWLLDQKPKVFEAQTINALDRAVQPIRRGANEIINQAIPEAGFSKFLKDYTTLGNALERMSTKVDLFNVSRLAPVTKAWRSLINLKTGIGALVTLELAQLIPGLTAAALPVLGTAGGIYTLFRLARKSGRGIRSGAISVLEIFERAANKAKGARAERARVNIKEIRAAVPQLQEPPETLLLEASK